MLHDVQRGRCAERRERLGSDLSCDELLIHHLKIENDEFMTFYDLLTILLEFSTNVDRIEEREG